MKVASFGLIAFLVFSFFCCSSQKTEWKGTIEEMDGVTVIKNPKEPMYGGKVLTYLRQLLKYSKNPFFYFQQLSSLKINFSEKCSA
jgi:hypothetical protein